MLIPAWVDRSNCSSRFPTVQPRSTPPIRSVAGAMALSKWVSQKGEAPEMSLMGDTFTPG